MPDSLYEHDALAWSEQQAALLRRMAAGERLNEAPDWENIVEEIQDLGLSELRGCRSNLRRALEHLLKLHLEPTSPSAAHWRGEAIGFLTEARERFTPSMRQRITLSHLYETARFRMEAESLNREKLRAITTVCPYTLDDLLTPHANPATLAALLATS